MSEQDLQDAFRQLALDLGALDDEENRTKVELVRGEHKLVVEFRAYKAALAVHVSNKTSRKRPRMTLRSLGALDRAGKKLGTDDTFELDDEFVMAFDIETEAPKAAVNAIFASAEARKAAFDLDAAKLLPVWINDQSVGIADSAGVKDLAQERIERILEVLVRFERALGEWDEREPTTVRDERGRRVIRKKPRSSSIAPLLDWSPLAAIFVSLFIAIPYSALPGYSLDNGLSVAIGIAGIISVITFVVSLRALKGEKSAFARAISRTIGVTVILTQLVHFGLHLYNRAGGTSHVESVTVLDVIPDRKTKGTTEFQRAGDPRIHRIPTLSRSSVRGKAFRVVIHIGRLGWGWVEYPD